MSCPPSSCTHADKWLSRQQLRTRYGGRVILLVEDNVLNREMTRLLLMHAGLLVEEAENGQIAVAKAEQCTFDLILMDIRMPCMDGLTATRLIRQQAHHATTPILALTACAFSQDQEACMAAGMNDFITKPLDIATVYARLLYWLDTADAQHIAC